MGSDVPEVFCTENGGFDAVIGNPPYEVLSQKESGLDPAALKAFVECEPFYRPAIRGKQNHRAAWPSTMNLEEREIFKDSAMAYSVIAV